MQTIFAFDTATSTAVCALVRNGEPAGERWVEARSVLAAAEELTRSAGISPAEIDALVVGTGPGSFTSIRIGLATARGLVLGLGIPVAGVSTLLAYDGGRPVIDARRGEIFTLGSGSRRPVLERPEQLGVAGERLIGDGAIRYRELFEAAGAEVPPDDDPRHRPSALRLVGQADGRAFGDADALEPLYLRTPDAVPS